jgi:hypothetical protein
MPRQGICGLMAAVMTNLLPREATMKMDVQLLAAALASAIVVVASIPQPVSAQSCRGPYGCFSGPIQTEWHPNGRDMKILTTVTYTDPNGMAWTVPSGSVVDGASIPAVLRPFVGEPLNGTYRDASVFHDVACQTRERTWEVTHLAFYYAMLASNVSSRRAKIMYSGVYHFGPRWQAAITRPSNDPLTSSTDAPSTDSGARSTSDQPAAAEPDAMTDSGAIANDDDSENVQPRAQWRRARERERARRRYSRPSSDPATTGSLEAEFTEQEFEALVEQIETREYSSDPMNLEEIQEFSVP